MAYFRYKCTNCQHEWQGKKVGTRCPNCLSPKFKRNLNKTRYDLLDKAAENYAKLEEFRSKSK